VTAKTGQRASGTETKKKKREAQTGLKEKKHIWRKTPEVVIPEKKTEKKDQNPELVETRNMLP
jgi:hypothetical protein